jgi:hypothetical protein
VRVDAGICTNQLNDPSRIPRILPREEALAPTNAHAALVVGSDCQIARLCQVVQHTTHLRRLVSRLRVNYHCRQRPALRRSQPLQANAQVPTNRHLARALGACRRPPLVHEVVINAPGKGTRQQHGGGAEPQ